MYIYIKFEITIFEEKNIIEMFNRKIILKFREFRGDALHNPIYLKY